MNPPLRVAVAGLGFMGATHISAWRQVARAELAAVISSNPQKLAGDLSGTGGNLTPGETRFDFTRQKRYSTLAEALNDTDIDALDLCLPTDHHADAGIAALRAGKHVLLEKPLARTSRQAFALLEESRQSGRVLMAGHVLRFFLEWRELARHANAAPLKLASFRRNCARPSWSPWLADPSRSGGAPLDLLIHDADFALHCFGTPERISAVGVDDPANGIDWITAQCSFARSGPVTISGGWHPAPHYPFSMAFQLVTAETTLEWSSAGGNLASFRKNNDPVDIPLPASQDPWVDQLQYFTDCALAGSHPVLSPPAAAAQAVRFVEIMVESRKRNGESLPWTD